MKTYLKPWQLLLLILAGWINHRQQEVIEYLRAKNDVLREKLNKKHILLNNDQRRRLAVKGKIPGHKTLEQGAAIVTPVSRFGHVASTRDYIPQARFLGSMPLSVSNC